MFKSLSFVLLGVPLRELRDEPEDDEAELAGVRAPREMPLLDVGLVRPRPADLLLFFRDEGG